MGPFSRGPIRMTSLNSLLITRRRRRGTTSSLLINIHPNPGPRPAASRRKRSSEHTTIPYRLSDAQSQEIEVRLRAGETVEAIARAVGCKIETINLRRARLRQLGEIKLYPAGRPPKADVAKERMMPVMKGIQILNRTPSRGGN